jgi:hypothetical protein
MLRLSLTFAVLLCLFVPTAASAAPPAKTFTTLVLPLTFTENGAPTPWTGAEIEDFFKGEPTSLDSFLHDLTAGAYRVEPTVAPWLTLSGSRCGNAEAEADAAARAQGFEPSAYDRVYYLTSAYCLNDGGHAEMSGRKVWLRNNLSTFAVIHEFGHTLGLWHANLLACTQAGVPVPLSDTCSEVEYGDGWDAMGSTAHQPTFSTWQRLKAGILLGSERLVNTTQTVDLDAASSAGTTLIRVPRQLPGAGAAQSFALEYRDRGSVWDAFAPQGVTVRLVTDANPFAGTQLIDMHPSTGGYTDAPLGVGERFEDPVSGVALRVVSIAGGKATVEVTAPEPRDDVPPQPPKSFRAVQVKGGVALSWLPAHDEGSGTASYRLFRDSVLIATVPATSGPMSQLDAVSSSHTYQVRAVDAAGNVGPAAKTGLTWVPVEAKPAADRAKPTLTLSPKVGKRAVRLPGRKLKVTGRDDRAGVTVKVTVSGKPAKLRKGVLQLTVKQARRSTIKITVTDAAANRTTTTLKVKSGRATRQR